MVSWFTRANATSAASSREADASATPAPKTAFVLLGGGARGAAQAGALAVLLDRGIVPDLIVGISAGSWNGAYLAIDPTPERALKLEGLWISTTSNDIIGPTRWVLALNALANRTSLYDSAGMRRVAERYLDGRHFEDLSIPLTIVASDLISGNAKLFTEGELLPAMVASSAMPGIFPPLRRDDEVLADGGLTDWAGCLAAMEQGATRIYLLSCGAGTQYHPQLRTFRHVFERSMQISNRNNFVRTVFALRAAGVDVIPVFPEMTSGALLNFNRAPEYIHAGRHAAEQALAEWEKRRRVATPAPSERESAS
jgi:NTE family protein